MNLTNLVSASSTAEIYRDGDKAIKLFRPDCPKTVALYDALTHARVEEAGLNVPKIYDVTVTDGRWAVVMDYIEGKTMAQLMAEQPEKKEDYINQMVDIQIGIHTHTMPRLSKLKDKLSRVINELDVLDDVKRYELLSRLESRPKHIKLCHGNFTPDNIILNENGVYVLDWHNARQGNASADVSNTYLIFSLNDKEMAELYLNRFCQQTNTSKKYVQDWLPLVAAARLSLGKPEEHDFLMHWLDVVLYE